MLRTWQREMMIADAQLRARYYTRLIEVAKLSGTLARIHAETSSIEIMKVYLGDK